MNKVTNKFVWSLLILANIAVSTDLCMENPDTSNMTPIAKMEDTKPFLGKLVVMTGGSYYTAGKPVRYGIVNDTLETYYDGRDDAGNYKYVQGYSIYSILDPQEISGEAALVPYKIEMSNLRMRVATPQEKVRVFNNIVAGERRFSKTPNERVLGSSFIDQ